VLVQTLLYVSFPFLPLPSTSFHFLPFPSFLPFPLEGLCDKSLKTLVRSTLKQSFVFSSLSPPLPSSLHLPLWGLSDKRLPTLEQIKEKEGEGRGRRERSKGRGKGYFQSACSKLLLYGQEFLGFCRLGLIL
jgi:hypothetical protein